VTLIQLAEERVDNQRISLSGRPYLAAYSEQRADLSSGGFGTQAGGSRGPQRLGTIFELELLALAYDRLADQARRNAQNNVVYEYDPESPAQRRRAQAQQQQQAQREAAPLGASPTIRRNRAVDSRLLTEPNNGFLRLLATGVNKGTVHA
jgi:hypothetical protein